MSRSIMSVTAFVALIANAAMTQVPARAGAQVRITADAQRALGAGEFEAEGNVDVAIHGVRIRADRVRIRETKDAGAQPVHELRAEGNVVLERGDERLTLERLSLEVPSGRGAFAIRLPER
jgi:lipopolysaccharide assembly outer membrane protein LptD (OstA)